MLVLVLAGLVWWRLADEPYVASPPDPTGATAVPATAAATLDSFQAALRAGDEEAAAELGADSAAAELLAAAAGNAESLRLGDVTLRYLSETGAVSDGAWPAAAEVTWRFRGFDGDVAARGEIEFGFADEGAAIASVGAREGLTPLWLQGPVTSRRTDRALVLSADPDAALGPYLRQAREAVAVVRRVLGGDPRLVVEVPASTEAMHRAVGAEGGRYDAVAAVTTSTDASLAPGSPLHVFLNPAVYDDLGDAAGQVVTSHEAVHVVTEAPFAQSAPLWLLEGFADYVALRDVELPLSTTAGQVREQVREEGVPDALPTRVEFDAEGHHLGATYEAAWLVCEVLAAEGGEDALVGFYDAMLDGGDLEQELQRWFGWNTAQLTEAWQQRLRDLAGDDG